jgi:hypothetical protein
LARFYKQIRYGRFGLESVYDHRRERRELCAFLEKHLNVTFPDETPMLGTDNDDRYRKFIRQIATKISGSLFQIVSDRARELNLYTYELRHGSKAETVFLGMADIPVEDTLWKELLIFFMNTKATNGHLRFLRETPPLDFDPADVGDYLDCFQSDAAKAFVVDQLETLYEDLPNKAERISRLGIIGSPDAYFPEDDEPEEDHREFEPLGE